MLFWDNERYNKLPAHGWHLIFKEYDGICAAEDRQENMQ